MEFNITLNITCSYQLPTIVNFRNSVADLEIFSSTDITFQWSKLKEPTLTHYKPLPIDTFDCYKKNVVDSNSVDDDADTIR